MGLVCVEVTYESGDVDKYNPSGNTLMLKILDLGNVKSFVFLLAE
jgi:hypothetical protein